MMRGPREPKRVDWLQAIERVDGIESPGRKGSAPREVEQGTVLTRIKGTAQSINQHSPYPPTV